MKQKCIYEPDMIPNFFQTETYGKFTSITFVCVSLVPYRLMEIERRRNSSLMGITVVSWARGEVNIWNKRLRPVIQRRLI